MSKRGKKGASSAKAASALRSSGFGGFGDSSLSSHVGLRKVYVRFPFHSLSLSLLLHTLSLSLHTLTILTPLPCLHPPPLSLSLTGCR